MATRSQDTDSNRQGNRRQQSQHTNTRTDIDRVKRAISAVLGGVLFVRGLRRRSLRGVAMALAGSWLLYRTLGGAARTKEALDSGTETLDSRTETLDPRADSRKGGRLEAADTMEVSRSITVGKPADELYEIWRDPDELSQIMGHFAEITSSDGESFHWTVHGPRDRDISWETRIVGEEPGEFLQWETTEDVVLPNEGSVRFRPAPGDRGTEVTLSVRFDPPGGTLGNAALERLEIAPKTLVAAALRRFKSLAETGEIQTLERNPSARGKGDLA